jgi:NTP pyrophosphatase (non-canonical NTP hydrolase)
MTTIENYAEWAAAVELTLPGRDAEAQRLAYLALGLAGEAGEAVETVKRLLRDGAWSPDHLAEELGDVAWYWVRLCAVAGRSPSEVLEASMRKIDGRLAARRARGESR